MRKTITVGGVPIGGDSPVTVQSMTTAKTSDVETVLAQILTLENAGCDIVRVAVPDMPSALAISEIKSRIHIPLVADIHFDYKLALASIEAGADKIRINPGNIGSRERVAEIANAAKARGIPIRVGVNSGSLEQVLLTKYGSVTAEALVESAMRGVGALEESGFTDICVSVKSSDVMTTVLANRMLGERMDYPLHIGVTEAGTEFTGIIRSSAGIGALLADDIGDTIRVSLTADPVREVEAGIELLRSLGLRATGARLVSCPTCARCDYDMMPLAVQIESRLSQIKNRDLTVALMGCVVNGPGEAREADFGVAGGRGGEGIVFRHGVIVGRYPQSELVDRLFEMIGA